MFITCTLSQTYSPSAPGFSRCLGGRLFLLVNVKYTLLTASAQNRARPVLKTGRAQKSPKKGGDRAAFDQTVRAALAVVDLHFRCQAQGVVDRRQEVFGRHRVFLHVRGLFVGRAVDLPTA